MSAALVVQDALEGASAGSAWPLLLTLVLLGLLVLLGGLVLLVLLQQRRGLAAAAQGDPAGVELLREISGRLEALERAVREGSASGRDPAAERALLDELRATRADLGERVDAAAAGLRDELATERVLVPAVPTPTLSERVTDRLLAMGYERVQIVTDSDQLGGIAEAGGDVLVEASRQGVLHKGRVRVRDGVVADVDVNPTYSIFP